MVQYSFPHTPRLDESFGALSDRTRRAVLERLGRRSTSVSELAAAFDMTVTGMAKHVRILEKAGLVATHKVGRVRTCRLGARRLDHELGWIASYREMLETRLDRLGEFLERAKGDER